MQGYWQTRHAAGLARREFLLSSAGMAAASLLAAPAGKPRIGLVQSTHGKLGRTVSPEHPLDYALVRDMVWRAIEYGKPAAGSLEAKIRPGSWVVIKPNIVGLASQTFYRPGDTTDLRVIRAAPVM